MQKMNATYFGRNLISQIVSRGEAQFGKFIAQTCFSYFYCKDYALKNSPKLQRFHGALKTRANNLNMWPVQVADKNITIQIALTTFVDAF